MNEPIDRAAGQDQGERRKGQAHALLEARREAYLCRARRAMLARLLEVGRATADDAAEAVGPVPGIDPRWRGPVPGPLAKAGIIRPTGIYVKSCRPVAHARRLILWELADWAEAKRWLAENPEPDDDPLDEASPLIHRPGEAPAPRVLTETTDSTLP